MGAPGYRPPAQFAPAPGPPATGSILGFSLPNFWVGLMLIMVFAVLLPDLVPGWPRLLGSPAVARP